MNFVKRMRQWLTSIFLRRQSTSSPKQVPPLPIVHDWLEERLKIRDLAIKEAQSFLSGEHDYQIEPKGLKSRYLCGTIYDWKWTPDGLFVRQMTGHYWITSKTKRFQQSFYAQAVLEQDDMKGDDWRKIVKLMEEKTYMMEITFTTVLEDSFGKGKNFPYSRGRFTVLDIEDYVGGTNDNQGNKGK